ncbi:phenylacetate--CoA ligase family protein [Candidatus Bipolaricaulota bacterium]
MLMERMNRLARFRIRKSDATTDRALRFLASEAYKFVPYYRELYASAGIVPSDISSASSLAIHPITHRNSLAIPPQTRFLNENADRKRLHASHTSGSTGSPATIFLSPAERQYRRLLLFRAIRARFPHFLPHRITDIGQATTTGTPLPPFNLGPFHLTRIPGNIPMPEQVSLYMKSAPRLLEGYAGCLELLADALHEEDTYPRPRYVISRGEVLLDQSRKLIEDVFGCPVADFYNSEEIGNIAWECRDRRGVLHVNTDACILELLDDQDCEVLPGIEGRVVITNLYNRTMPLLRYDTGDYAVWDSSKAFQCSCGAKTPTLLAVHGRADDFITMPDYRRVSPLVVLTTALNGCTQISCDGTYTDQVRQFQVIQEEIGKVIVRVVPGQLLPGDLHERLRAEFSKLHRDLEIDIETVDEIPLEASGKLKRIVSRIWNRRFRNAADSP